MGSRPGKGQPGEKKACDVERVLVLGGNMHETYTANASEAERNPGGREERPAASEEVAEMWHGEKHGVSEVKQGADGISARRFRGGTKRLFNEVDDCSSGVTQPKVAEGEEVGESADTVEVRSRIRKGGTESGARA